MAKPAKVGYDIGTHSLKIAVKQGNGFRFVVERLPENLMEGDVVSSPNAFSQFLRDVRNRHKIPAGPSAISLPSGQSLCRYVTLPQMTEEQLMMNLPYEFADFIHENDERYLFDYALCEPNAEQLQDNSMPMMAAAADKNLLASWTEIFSRAGVKLETVLPPEMSLISLAQHSPDRDICFVDLGQRQTRVIVVSGDHIQAVRELSLSCADIDRAIATHFDVDPYLASTYKETNYQGAQTLPECIAIYERIGIELLKVINFYQFTYRDSELHGVFFVGGGSSIQALTKTIFKTLSAEDMQIEEVAPEGGRAQEAGPSQEGTTVQDTAQASDSASAPESAPSAKTDDTGEFAYALGIALGGK